jgi:hypothetical protein
MPEILNSWKEIATYLDRGVRTIQRWAIEADLPIHRLGAGSRAPVFAFAHELNQWRRKRQALTDDGRTPGLQAKIQEVRKKCEQIINTLQRNGADFLFIDLGVANEMARSASNAGRNTEKRARNRKTARRAYNTILHLSGRLKMSQEERSGVKAQLGTLKRALEELGERF